MCFQHSYMSRDGILGRFSKSQFWAKIDKNGKGYPLPFSPKMLENESVEKVQFFPSNMLEKDFKWISRIPTCLQIQFQADFEKVSFGPKLTKMARGTPCRFLQKCLKNKVLKKCNFSPQICLEKTSNGFPAFLHVSRCHFRPILKKSVLGQN